FSFFFQAEDGIRDFHVTGVQTCALPISRTLKLNLSALGLGVGWTSMLTFATRPSPPCLVTLSHTGGAFLSRGRSNSPRGGPTTSPRSATTQPRTRVQTRAPRPSRPQKGVFALLLCHHGRSLRQRARGSITTGSASAPGSSLPLRG